MSEQLAARVEREMRTFDQGLQRDRYADILGSHAKFQVKRERRRLAHHALAGRPLHRVLEIGRQLWKPYLEEDGHFPEVMVCINISQAELDIGFAEAESSILQPKFRVMDAHHLEYDDGYFDMVCGLGVLHHLELRVALPEIARVLRPGGLFMFSEPLDNNPVGRLIRRLTPHARTDDEQPLRYEHLSLIDHYFDCEYHYEQALSVPVGIASRHLLKNPDNVLSRGAFRLDNALLALAPRLGPMYRGVTMIGTRRPGR
jgi:SAM-dependent methyltransferase